MIIALTSLSFIIVTLAFTIPINHQKQPRGIYYAPVFALLSLLLGFVFSQFSLWYTQASRVMGGISLIPFYQALSVLAVCLWLSGLYLTTWPNRHSLQRTVLFLLSATVLSIGVETHILIGQWADLGREGADHVAGILGDVGGITTGFISFFMTVFLGYRLLRSLRRDYLSKCAARELRS